MAESPIKPEEAIAGVVDGKIAILDPVKFEALLKPINEDFAPMLNDVAGTFAYGQLGLREVRDHFLPQLWNLSVPPVSMTFGRGDPEDPESVGFHTWPAVELKERLAEDGTVARQLGQQWIVLLDVQWEHNFRPRFAKALGLSEPKELPEPLFADIRRMRNDIVHHQGVATGRNSGRCEILEWFDADDEMLVTYDHVTEFMTTVGVVTRFAVPDA